ncbi:MAG: DUF4364 family protein [Nanoarchaeota archaeon]
MIFERNKEIYCIFEVLRILVKKKSKYSFMFKQTRVSHTTLQSVLRDLVLKGFVKKQDIGHMNVDYEITEKGKRLLSLLTEMKNLVK